MSDFVYFEDFDIGEVLTSATLSVSRDEAVSFAKEYDPQVQHIDEEGAKEGLFGELVISGWHTAAISMRLKLQTKLSRVKGGLIGMGIDSVKWVKPVKPGDTLKAVIEITDKRASNSRPDRGIVKYALKTLNQHDEVVMTLNTAVIMPRKIVSN